MDLPFQLEAFAKGTDGTLKPFTLYISPPQRHDEFEYQCNIDCPMIRKKTIAIFGDEPLFTAELCIRFVKLSLDHMNAELVDRDGKAVTLPKYYDIPESPLSDVSDDGTREYHGVVVSLKNTGDGNQLLCLDDVHRSTVDQKEVWGDRISYTVLPFKEQIPDELYEQIGWNIVERLEVRRVARK